MAISFSLFQPRPPPSSIQRKQSLPTTTPPEDDDIHIASNELIIEGDNTCYPTHTPDNKSSLSPTLEMPIINDNYTTTTNNSITNMGDTNNHH